MSTKAPIAISPDNEDEVFSCLDREPIASAEIAPPPTPAGLAEQQGATVLLFMGVVVFLLACASFLAGRSTIAVVLMASAVVTVIVATGLARLEVFELEILKLFGFLARFRSSK